MKYMVTGGVYENTEFKKIKNDKVEVYGPFDTYEAASEVWKSYMWLNVDNALHRLQIVEWEDE